MTVTPKVFRAAREFSRGGRTFEVGAEVSGGLLRELLAHDSVGVEPPFVTAERPIITNTKKEGSDNAADR